MADWVERYWGKARPAAGTAHLHHKLAYHCLDVAAVGMAYLRRAPALTRLIADTLGVPDDERLIGWVGFWLALHDPGKYSEDFQGQCLELFVELRQREPRLQGWPGVRHDSTGLLLWRSRLARHAGQHEWFGPQTAEAMEAWHCWARAVMGHHGQPPLEDTTRLHMARHFSREDEQAALACAQAARELLLPEPPPFEAVDPERLELASRALSWWIAGLAVLADWIGSNQDHFPYCSTNVSLPDYWLRAQAQAARALDAAGVLPVPSVGELRFEELFPQIAEPSPLQHWAATVELSDEPQIHLLEDVTGAGKTEAAVMLTHRLMARGVASGFFIGLPTMATANAMYGRIAEVYSRLFPGLASLVLSHGQRMLVEAFADSILRPGEEERDPRQHDETATARCAAWLADHNKSALLAPGGVGTVDQALLAALQSKHQSLRLLGLFRKVLVVDEVHACDPYMQRVLETVLTLHARAGGSAILLSATLPLRMKQSVLGAFARGRHSAAPPLQGQDFPLITSWHASMAAAREHAVKTRPSVVRRLKVRYVSELSEVVSGILEALQAGRCVCWMRNTVADVLDAQALLAQHVPADRITVFHARFALRDRLATEGWMLDHFGKDSTPEGRAGKLVLASQVAEASLDADWDLVISDLAPIDRLLQRAGRLMRHVRDAHGRRLTDPDAMDGRGEPCLWAHGPAWTEQPAADWFKAHSPKAAKVYPHHAQLWHSARVLQEGQLCMPEAARRIIEAVYGEQAVAPEGLARIAQRAEGDGQSEASQGQQNSIKLDEGYTRGAIDWWAEAATPSRLGEPTTEVVLARWDGDRLQPWAEHERPRAAWAYSALRVAQRLIAKTAEPADPARQRELQRVLQELPGHGRWSVVLALESTDEGWVGYALAGPEGKEVRSAWRYDPKLGLLRHEEE
jgi:CRISPR-associated endonuclease/helicase Cas3